MRFSTSTLLRSIVFALLACLVGSPPVSAEQPTTNAAGQIFVAVGYGGRRMSSTDGIHWQNVQQWADKGADDSNNLISVAFGQGKFVAVGGGGWTRETQAGHILVSTDGAAWREVKKMPFRVSPILYTGNRFVAGGPNRQLLYSDDSETWTAGATVELPKGLPGWAFWFRRGAAGNGHYIFVGNADKDQHIWWCLSTTNGQTVANFSTDLPEVKSMVFGADKFVIAAKDAIYTSVDGSIWTRQSTSPSDTFHDIIWTGKEFYLFGKQASYTSADAIAWKPVGKAAPCGVLWSDGTRFIGTGWPGKMWSSTDAVHWTPGQQPLPGMGINQIAVGVLEGKK